MRYCDCLLHHHLGRGNTQHSLVGIRAPGSGHRQLVLALFQMADNGWIGGICHAEPGLPKLLILSLEHIGVVDPPEYVYREYDSRGTLRCDVMIFVGKSTRYLMWIPGSSPPLDFVSLTPTGKPPVKPSDVYA